MFRDRIYSPAVTLWALLWPVLSADHTCGDAVARVVAQRVMMGQPACSANTGSYCAARQRLPLALLVDLLREVGHRLDAQAPTDWLWKGRRVKVVDGTTVSMPDTKANQLRFPQARTQKPGVGFPIARLVVVFSLGCAAALDLAMGPYKGKKTGENSLFRTLMDRLERGDVVLADLCYSGYCDVAELYRRRWDAELDLRSLKCVLQMDVMRCATPEMVEKELWAHLLAYNAVRLIIAQAAATHGRRPTRLSFSGSLKLLRTFHAMGLLAGDNAAAAHDALLLSVAQCTVPHRPDRVEPRAVKRRPKPQPLLRVPRSEARKTLL